MPLSVKDIRVTTQPIDVQNARVFVTIPEYKPEKKPGQLTAQQIETYFDQGYVVLNNFFTKDELNPAREAIKQEVDKLALKLHDAGKIQKLYRDYGLFQRLTMLEKEFPGTAVILHKLGRMPKAFQDLWANERLLNIIEQLIGPDIAGNPVWNLRTKVPQNPASVVPWHQDSSYLDDESFNQLIPTAWIPLIDANETNGCMQMMKNGHKVGRIATHQCCVGPTWYTMVNEEEMARSLGVTVENDSKVCCVPYGGLILFHNLTPHRSLVNVSNDIRWSIDLRWQHPDFPGGLWGLKDPILMRSADNPNHAIDWETFNLVDRTKEQNKSTEGKEGDEFDITITGPWMRKWEITHENIHTRRMNEDIRQEQM